MAGYQVHATEAALGAFAALAITILNILGIRLAARVQAVVVILLLLAGAVLAFGGLINMEKIPDDTPMWIGFGGVFSVIIMVPFLFVGFDVIPQSAEEIGGAMKDIGKALVYSIAAAVLFYLIIVFAVGLAPLDPDSVDIATADAAGAWWDTPSASAFIIIAGIGGILTSWNAFLIGGSRALFAMARSGQLPGALSAVHPRFGTPYIAIAVIGALSIFAPLLGRSALVWVVNAGAFGIVIAYLFVAASFIALRLREPTLERPYKAPMGMGVGVIAIILSVALILLYLPPSPAALAWPQEWGLVGVWTLIWVDVLVYVRAAGLRRVGCIERQRNAPAAFSFGVSASNNEQTLEYGIPTALRHDRDQE